MKMVFEFLEHTADLKFRASGKSFVEALEQAGFAVTSAIAGKSEIKPTQLKEFTITINKPQILVHDFLAELVFLFSTEQFLPSKFELELKEAIGYRLNAKVWGEVYDETRHKLETEIKAVTYHQLLYEETDNGVVLEVVCDT